MITAPEAEPVGVLVVSDLTSSLPLEHTDVVAQLTGPIASVAVKQRFGNPLERPADLVYKFASPHEAAIVSFELKIGTRVVTSRVEEKERARSIYEEARHIGRRAGLLTEERENLLSVEIANVQPGETIEATVRYQERLRFDDGRYSFVFPMGITPKYHSVRDESDTLEIPITVLGSPIAPVDVIVSIDAGTAIGKIASPSHQIDVTRLDDRRAQIRIAGEEIANKDFVLSYSVSDSALATAAWISADHAASTVLITALPPAIDATPDPLPREFIFVIDRSGSMGGTPILQAKNALRACIRSLQPTDTFAVIAFDDRVEQFRNAAVNLTTESLAEVDRWLDTIQARGGTEMLTAIETALAIPYDATRRRIVVFLTDGAVSGHTEITEAVRSRIGSGRLFSFGVGPSVNRALISALARIGRGTAEYLQADEDIEEALIRFQDRVSFPVVEDIAIEWRGATAWDVYPERLPDLYAGQPLEVVARVKVANGAAAAIITGTRNGQPWRAEIPLGAAINDPAIPRIWAKARVERLMELFESDRREFSRARNEIIALAIDHKMLTQFTSHVAVDSEVTGGGESVRVCVATPMPEGVMFAMADALYEVSTEPVARSLRSARALDAKLNFDAIGGAQLRRPAGFADPLPHLARTQNADGSWGDPAGDVETTAAALLAFVRRGHTTRSGSYRRQLKKTVAWLLAATATGDPAVARAIALAELGDAIGDATLSAMRQGVTLPVAPRAITSADDVRAAALTRSTPIDLDDVRFEFEDVWFAAIVS